MMKTRTNKNRKTESVFVNHNTSVFEYDTRRFIHDKGDLRMKKMQHRAISDIIATLLLLGITVAGAVLVASFFQGNAVFRPDASNPGTQTASIKIVGYDTRDGPDISGITTIDNTLTGILTSDEIIVLNVENQGMTKVVLQAVEINDVDHTWDQSTGDLPPTYPAAGKFSIIPTSNDSPIPIISTNELQRNDQVRLVIKLNTPDINLNDPVRIRIITNLIDSSETIITSGGAR